MCSHFLQFGHALQQMLTTAPYGEFSGQNCIELDAVDTCANVMSMMFYHPYTLKEISSHVETGASLDDEMISTIIKGIKLQYMQ